jgi:hypothetical protein
LVNLLPRFSKYFPEVVSDKYKWFTDLCCADSPKNYDFSIEEENCIDIISDTCLKVQFPQQESFVHPPSFHNILPVRDWICSSGSHQIKVSFYDEPGK